MSRNVDGSASGYLLRTVGGLVEVVGLGLLPGLGSCEQWLERLDARIGAAALSIPAIKAVEIGDGQGKVVQPNVRLAVCRNRFVGPCLPQRQHRSPIANVSGWVFRVSPEDIPAKAFGEELDRFL